MNKNLILLMAVMCFPFLPQVQAASTNGDDAQLALRMTPYGLSGSSLQDTSDRSAHRAEADALFKDISEKYLTSVNWNDTYKGYKQVLKLDPMYASAWFNLGILNEYIDHLKPAKESFKIYLQYFQNGADNEKVKKELSNISKLEAMDEVTRKRFEYNLALSRAKVLEKSKLDKAAGAQCQYAKMIDDSRWEAYGFMSVELARQHSIDEAQKFKKWALERVNPADRKTLDDTLTAEISKAQGETSPAQSVITTYVSNLRAEVAWASSVKESFSKEKIGATCSTYKPEAYYDCYFKFVNDSVSQKKLTTTGIILLQTVGVMIVMDKSRDGRDPAEAEDKSQPKLIKALNISELVVTLVEKDQEWRRTQKFSPAGPEADALALIANSTDDEFQVEALKQTGDMLAKSAAVSCVMNNSCHDLQTRQKYLEDKYWKLMAAAPKSHHKLAEWELKDAATKAHLSPQQVGELIGAN